MRYICILFFLGICLSTEAGVNKHTALSRRRFAITADTDTVARKQSVSVGISYGSDASFFGRTGPVK
ncbi:MAG: hypothetical protein JST19_19505, partial [Bacteroidetes bacterium]|nr:hypothetical protein [Bacteroidota bacterium]